MQACGRPTHTIGLHYFNPVQLMQLVEVVCTPEASEDVIKTAFAFVEQTKKVAVRCKDTPGFIVNRLLIPYLMQASSACRARFCLVHVACAAVGGVCGRASGRVFFFSLRLSAPVATVASSCA